MRKTPTRQKKTGFGRRRINGTLLDVAGARAFMGYEKDKAIYAMVSRGRIPFRKLGGRVVFLRSELEEFLATLPGVSLAQLRAREEKSS